MSLKQEIETWVQALAHYDNNEFDEALKVFFNIAETSKILFNCGVIYATLGEHYKAVDCYQRAIGLDKYFAIAYFQQGVSNFLVGDFEEALVNFNDTLLYLRGNTSIDYDQLGLKFQLYSCEVLFNRGLCYIYLQQVEAGMQDLQFAAKEKVKPDHDVIDDAIRENAEGYTVFSIPVGVVYRPSPAKVKNLKTKEYLGKARLVAASDRTNAFTGFGGLEIKTAPDPSRDDRPPENISYGATNLVQKNLTGRGRQQSEPPLSRNVFPPTPPPETEKPGPLFRNGSPNGAAAAAPARGQRPPMLDLDRSANYVNGVSATQPGYQNNIGAERPRLGTIRTASEPRGPPSRQFQSVRNREGPPATRQPLYGETTGTRRPDGSFAPVTEADYEEVYDMYREASSAHTNHSRRSRQRGALASDGSYYLSDAEDDSLEDAEFEMIGAASQKRAQQTQQQPPRRGASRRADTRKVRVKVHADSDTRFIMIDSSIGFGEFEGKIREKFGFKGRLKIHMQDDGDMVTMGDQDDLDLLLTTAKAEAKKENREMGKMEIWAQELR